MSTASTKLQRKSRCIGAVVVIASVFLLSTTVMASNMMTQKYWARFCNSPRNSMAEATGIINDLDPNLQKKALICINNGKYEIVHKRGGTHEEATALVESLHLFSVVEIPENQCFHPAEFMKGEDKDKATVKFPEAPNGHKATRSVVRILPNYANTPRAKTNNNHVPTILENTSAKVLPEVTTQITLSARDINRITCSGNRPVKDIVFSSEKGITPKIAGSNAFIKFMVQQNTATGEIELSNTPTEMYMICGTEGTIYSLIAIPKDVPSQTVELTASVDKIQKNLSLFKGLTFEKKVLLIVKQAYKAEYPESYTVQSLGEPVDSLAEVGIQARLVREVEIEGEGLRVKEFSLNLMPEFEASEIRVMEKYFLLPEMTESPVAIAMDTQFIDKKRQTRLIILEQPGSAKM